MKKESSIVLSIHPEYVKRILSGEKRFEYRRKLPLISNTPYILIYETSPIKKYVAIAEVLERLIDTPEGLWERTQHASGISYNKYQKYFANSCFAAAYKLGRIYRLPQNNLSFPIVQSYCYVSTSFVEGLIKEHNLSPLEFKE